MGINQTIDITTEEREVVLGLLQRHLPGVAVWVYGSRAKWTSRPQSDLDLVVFATPEQSHKISDLREALEESNLPFRVDLFVWDEVPEQFHREIKRDHVVLVAEGEWRGMKCAKEMLFGDIAKLIRSNVEPSELGNTPYIGLEHIGENSLTLTGQGIASSVSSTKTSFQKGDILFGKLRPYFRKVFQAPFNGICSTDIWVVRSKNVYQQFLYYCMASQQFVDFATAGTEGTRMPRAKWDWVSQYKIPVPPLPEQRAIAHILGTLDDKIELNRRMNETLETMAQTLFKSWFVDFDPVRAKMTLKQHHSPLRGSDWTVERARAYLDRLDPEIAALFPDKLVDSELGETPEGWEVGTLRDLIDLNPKRPLRKGDIAPYLDMANMPTTGHVPDKWFDRPFGSGMRFTNGDTLFARITPCLENGKTAYINFLPDDSIGWGSTEYIVMRPKPTLPNEFAYCLARSASFREYAIHNMTGTSGRQRVPATAISYFPLVAPKKDIAKSFGKIVESLFTQANVNADESRILVSLRDTLLPKLISGKIRLPDMKKFTETSQ